MNFNVTESEGPRILWQIEYSVSESCSSFLPQCSQHSCVSPVPPLAFQVCTDQQEIMWKKLAIFFTGNPTCWREGFFFSGQKFIFPQSERQCKNIPPYATSCLFYFFHCQYPEIPLFILIHALFPK